MKKIIVPTDFSNQATFALDLAYEIAKKEGAEITLVHVIEIPKKNTAFLGSSIDTEATLEGEDPMERVFYLKLIEKREEQFVEILDNPKYKGVTIKEKLVRGTPYEKIGELLTDVKADLIIMGTTGADSWEENLIGSTAEKVVRHSKCPVLTLRNRFHVKDIKRIVLASDFKDDLETYKSVPRTLKNFFNAELHLVYVNTPGHFMNEREIMKQMDEFTEDNKLGKIERHIYCHNNAGEGILNFAEDYKMDLIMMTTSGERSGIFRLFNHSIAEEIVNHSKKHPVVTLNIHK